MKNIAVLERGAIGQGNSGRNTQVVRSDYYHLESSRFFERSLKLYEGLSRELNYNIMLSQRGKVSLAHSPHEMEVLRRSRQRDPAEWRRLRDRHAARAREDRADAQPRQPLSHRRCRRAVARRHLAPRCCRVGVRARGRKARRRHRAGLRGHRLHDPRRARARRRDDARARRRAARADGGRRPLERTRAESGPQAADPQHRTAGDGDRAGEAADRHRARLRRHPRVREPDRARRNRDRRRRGRVQFYAQRGGLPVFEANAQAAVELFPCLVACASCASGPAPRTSRPTRARSWG